MIEKMIQKILSNPNGFRDLLLAAQGLVNEQFDANTQKLFGENEDSAQVEKLKNFKKTVKESILLTEKEKRKFQRLSNEDSYQLAREIILRFTAQEIKSPLNKS